jgi:hypothetical protein
MWPGHAPHYIGDDGDPQHVTKRSKGRDDRLTNLLWCCRFSHIAMDRIASRTEREVWEKRAREKLAQMEGK